MSARDALCLLVGSLFLLPQILAAETISWPGGAKTAVVLAYDDGLDSHLDNAAPSLDEHGFKGTFFVTLASASISDRLLEWRALTSRGHELGNHSIFHPCSTGMPGREWVLPYRDLDKYTVEQMRQEVVTANVFLQSIDGETKRVFAPPCGDLTAGGENYIAAVSEYFIAIRGLDIPPDIYSYWGPVGASGVELINYVENAAESGRVAIIVFHGVGGDHLAVSTEAHDELLDYLGSHRDTFWVDSYTNIVEHVATQTGQ